MELGAFFLVLAVGLLVGLYVAQPLFERRGRRLVAEAHETSALMAERDRVVNALQELDFDFNLNKIPAEDYPIQRAELLKKGADVLKQLDALTPNSHPASHAEAAADRIESAVAARRADLSSAQAVARDDDDVEALIASRRKMRKEKSGGFCPRCGKPVLVSDRFCPHCGKSIS
jgi:NADH pyrophosphatase NudC (nudix superfamily)